MERLIKTTLSLNGNWNLEIPGMNIGVVSATVPGSVYHDLLSATLDKLLSLSVSQFPPL